MKKYFLPFLFCISFNLSAQINEMGDLALDEDKESLLFDVPLREENLPPQVSSQFHDKYPAIEQATWTQNGENYAATFNHNGQAVRSEYNYDGAWIGDFTVIDLEKVPEAVKNQFSETLQGYDVQEAFEVKTEEGTLYQFLVSDGDQQESVRFDEEGKQVEIAESMDNAVKEE